MKIKLLEDELKVLEKNNRPMKLKIAKITKEENTSMMKKKREKMIEIEKKLSNE